MKRNYLLIILFLIGICLACTWYLFSQTHALAPNLSFTTISGKKIELAQLKGNPVIVTFWATDCASCVKEIPDLIDLYQQFHPKGLEIIAITLYYDIPSHVVEMSKRFPIPYDVTLDLKGDYAKAFGQVELTPTTFLISPTGEIVLEKTGLFDVANMKQEIQQLLKG